MFDDLSQLEAACKNCNMCKLCKTRRNVVFAEGPKDANVMFVGEGPGQEEDRTGNLFIGRSGKLMDMAFQVVGMDRKKLYLTNILKCRTPANRNPEEDECMACINYLRNQVMLVKPKVIVLLGSVALKHVLGKEYGLTDSRGKWVEKKGIKYLPTWHPAALLRDEAKKVDFIHDLELVLDEMNKEGY